jgi:hypothetical protein
MFSAIASTADIIRRHDYDVTNQPPFLAFIWQVEKSAPVHRHLHHRPSTRRVAADRHLASNAPRCTDYLAMSAHLNARNAVTLCCSNIPLSPCRPGNTSDCSGSMRQSKALGCGLFHVSLDHGASAQRGLVDALELGGAQLSRVHRADA